MHRGGEVYTKFVLATVKGDRGRYCIRKVVRDRAVYVDVEKVAKSSDSTIYTGSCRMRRSGGVTGVMSISRAYEATTRTRTPVRESVDL